MPRTTWFLIADATRARLLEFHRPERKLALLFEEDRADLRDREAQRDGDRPGRVHESSGNVRHAMEPHTNVQDLHREQFARELLARVHTEAQKDHFPQIVLVAPPQMLGTLRSVAPNELREHLVGELGKDLTKIPEHDLAGHLQEWMG